VTSRLGTGMSLTIFYGVVLYLRPEGEVLFGQPLLSLLSLGSRLAGIGLGVGAPFQG
jgi:hypothetical protein